MSDYAAPRHPVSIKAIISTPKGYAVLKNERDEWELPGGKLEYGETPVDTCQREIEEELGIHVQIGPLVDAWMYAVNGVEVLILTYGVEAVADPTTISFSDEHKELGYMSLEELSQSKIPQGYVASIRRWEAMTELQRTQQRSN